MPHDFKAKLTRREWFSASILASGALLLGFGRFAWPLFVPSPGKDSFAGGNALGAVGFVGEGQSPMDTLLSAELEGRLYTDLSTLTPTDPITDRKSTRLNSSHVRISYAVFCLKKTNRP